MSPSGTHRSHILAPFLCFCGIASATKLQAEWSSWKKLVRGQIHHSELNSLQALKPSDFLIYCTERLSEILTIILLYKCFVAQNDPNTNFYGLEFWCIPQPNCSKQSHQGTVQSQLFQPCRQLLVWDHRGRHDIAWPSWDWEGVPNETRSKLQTNWHIYEALSKWIATAFLVWDWEIIIILAFLKGPCGFRVFCAKQW